MKFLIEWPGLPSDVRVGVLSFDLHERISTPFLLQLDIVATSEQIDFDFLKLKKGTTSTIKLIIEHDKSMRQVWGHLTRITFNGELARSVYHYTLEVRGAPHLCSLNYNSRVLQDMTCSQVIEETLTSCGYSEGEDFKFSLQNTIDYPQSPYWIQQHQSDLSYVEQLIGRFGIFYFQDYSNPKQQLVFGDNNAALSEIKENLVYVAQSGMTPASLPLTKLSRRVHCVSAKFEVQPHLPSSELEPAEKEIQIQEVDGPSVGSQHLYGGDSGAKYQAQVRARKAATAQNMLEGESSRFDLFAGSKVKIQNNPKSEFNTKIAIMWISHRGDQPWPWHANQSGSENVASATYSNNFVAIPDAVPLSSQGDAVGVTIPSVTSAVIDGTDSKVFPKFSETTNYNIVQPYDQREDISPGERSRPVPMMRPFSAPPGLENQSAGWHLPVSKGATGIMGALQGDPQRPVLLGMLPSDRFPAPKTPESGYIKHQFSTPAGQSLIIMDKAQTGGWNEDGADGVGYLELASTTNASALRVGQWKENADQDDSPVCTGLGGTTSRVSPDDPPKILSNETMMIGGYTGDDAHAITEGVHWQVNQTELDCRQEWTIGKNSLDDCNRLGLRLATSSSKPIYTTLMELGQLEADQAQSGIKLSNWLDKASDENLNHIVIPETVPDQFILMGLEEDRLGIAISTRQNVMIHAKLGLFLTTCKEPDKTVSLVKKVNDKAWKKLDSKKSVLTKVDSFLGSKLAAGGAKISPNLAGKLFGSLKYSASGMPSWYGQLDWKKSVDLVANDQISMLSNFAVGLSSGADVDIIGVDHVGLSGQYGATLSGAKKGVGLLSSDGPVYAMSQKANATARSQKGAVKLVSGKSTSVRASADSRMDLSTSKVEVICKSTTVCLSSKKIDLKCSKGAVNIGDLVTLDMSIKAKKSCEIKADSMAGLAALQIELA